MKNKATQILLIITLAFILLTFGFLIGRNTERSDIRISADSDTADTQQSFATSVTDGKININTADISALCELPGIGPSTAQKIIEYRQTSGKFQSITDLLKVSGIGEKTLYSIADLITVGG